MTEAAKKLLSVLEMAVQLPNYREGAPHGRRRHSNGVLVTYCSNLARDVLDSRAKKGWVDDGTGLPGWDHNIDVGDLISEYDYDITCLNPGASLEVIMGGTLISVAYRNANIAWLEGKLEKVTPEEAQNRANLGIPIWGVSEQFWHEVIVCPDDQPYNKKRGPRVGQAGGGREAGFGETGNGIMYSNAQVSFGAFWDTKDLCFYQFPTYR